MSLWPFSDHPRGLFVSVDGPSGAGKSTIVDHIEAEIRRTWPLTGR